jgi:hypothetical protein
MAKAASSGSGDIAQEQQKFSEILKLLRKKKPLNCAVRIGGPAGIVLEADKKKKPPALRKLAKTNGGGPKGVSGVISLQGKIITIQTVEEEFPGALEKLMKTYFRDMNQPLRVELIPGGADENGVDDDDDEDDAAVAEDEGVEEEEEIQASDTGSPREGSGGGTDAARATLMKSFRAMNQPLKGALASADPQLRNRLGTLAKTFGAEVKGEDMRKAAAVLQLLKQTLEAPRAGATANGPAASDGRAASAEPEEEIAATPHPAIAERRTSRLSQLEELEANVDALLARFAGQGAG